MEPRLDYFLSALPIPGKGMLGIFLVTGLLVLGVTLLNNAFSEG